MDMLAQSRQLPVSRHVISSCAPKEHRNAVFITVNAALSVNPLKKERHSKRNLLRFKNPGTPTLNPCRVSRLVAYTRFLKLHSLICGFIVTAVQRELQVTTCAHHKHIWGNGGIIHSFLSSALDIGQLSV